ncbi:hypothetical protein QYE76_008852 [Lolium multiflorum]|uniref:Retrotransposon gag domain-containing protein n=1 Tax=Lolium multiflorum TaxID=4521 RepID=A0AAD8TQV0_LOLMU|nr:hypothetical protein QYE76_008852 [Lolium multiflorum]
MAARRNFSWMEARKTGDEDIPTKLLPPSLQDEDNAAVKLKSNEVRIGPMTRARAKLLKQQVRRWSKHRTRRRGVAGCEAGYGAGHEAGPEDIPRTREGGEGGMREGRRRSPGRRHTRYDRPPRRPARSHVRFDRVPRRISPAPTGPWTGAHRTPSRGSGPLVRSPPCAKPGSNRPARSLARSTGPQAGRVRVNLDQIPIWKNKDGADIVSWREYEALRNETQREFRAQGEGLPADIEKVTKKLDTTDETVNAIQVQVTDIQRSIQALQLAVENLTQQQQPEEEDSVHGDFEEEQQQPAAGHGVGCGNCGRGFVELGARRVPPHQQDDGFGKPKFSIPKFEGDPDVEEYLTWELKIEKLWRLHDYTEDRKIKLVSSKFDGYALRWWDGITRAHQEDEEFPILTWREMKAIMQARFVPTNYL